MYLVEDHPAVEDHLVVGHRVEGHSVVDQVEDQVDDWEDELDQVVGEEDDLVDRVVVDLEEVSGSSVVPRLLLSGVFGVFCSTSRILSGVEGRVSVCLSEIPLALVTSSEAGSTVTFSSQ